MNATVKIDLFPSADRDELKTRAKKNTLKPLQWVKLKLKNPLKDGTQKISVQVIWVFKKNRKPVRKVVSRYFKIPTQVDKFCSSRSVDRYVVQDRYRIARVVEPTDHYHLQDGLIFKLVDL